MIELLNKKVNNYKLTNYYRVDSDEDETISGFSPEPILEPKDPYSLRPLPIKIGTPAFMSEDNIGLDEYRSEDEGTVIHVELYNVL